jgi:hypothetical protein
MIVSKKLHRSRVPRTIAAALFVIGAICALYFFAVPSPLDLEEEVQFVKNYGQKFEQIKDEFKCKEEHDDFSKKLIELGVKDDLIENGHLSMSKDEYGSLNVCTLYFARGFDEWVEYDLDRQCWYLEQPYKQLVICKNPSKSDLLKLVGTKTK